MFDKKTKISSFDLDLWGAISAEQPRQKQHIELIASEIYASYHDLEAQGTILTNKYAEGYPGKRYYGECKHVDVVEQLAIDRAKELFKADWVNVQPHSGSQANAAVYLALLSPGYTIMGMSLAHGGHHTHGAKINFSGKLYNAMQYGINKRGLIDYDKVERMTKECQPKMLVAGFSAYSRHLDFARFRTIADQVDAILFVDMDHVAGLVAAGLYPSPVPYADVVTTTTHKMLRGPRGGLIMGRTLSTRPDVEKKIASMVFPGVQGGPLILVIAAKAVALKEALHPDFRDYQAKVIASDCAMASVFVERGFDIVSGGTDNHLFLVCLLSKGLTGKAADATLGRARVTMNKNAVPNDPQTPLVTSGIRIRTPAVTTRRFCETEVRELAGWIFDILDVMDDDTVIKSVRKKVSAVTKLLPVYG